MGGVVVHLGAQRTRVRALSAWVVQHGGADARVYVDGRAAAGEVD